jgi:hypothetical protein
MTGWAADELERIGAAEELQLAPLEKDGSLRKPVTIWVVRVGDELFVRSYRGRSGSWFRHVQERHEGHVSAGGVARDVEFVGVSGSEALNAKIDTAYRSKYSKYSATYVDPMVASEARQTTLKLVPSS